MRRQRLGKKLFFLNISFPDDFYTACCYFGRNSVETCVFTRDDADKTDGDEVTEGENF